VAVRAVRAAARVPIGVSTGAWIEPDPERRAALVRTWDEPDMASVNLGETGAELVIAALLDADIGFEDTLLLPDGAIAESNESLVRAALAPT
jgi:uncharacterized protein (DUF849 family)